MTPVVPAFGQLPLGAAGAAEALEDEDGVGCDADGEVEDDVGEIAEVTDDGEADDGDAVRVDVLRADVVAIVCGRLPAASDTAECEPQPASATRQKSTITTAMPGN